MISEAILIPKIYATLQEIASNFSKFSGEAPLALGSGLRPLTGPPFPKFLDPPLVKEDVQEKDSHIQESTHYGRTVRNGLFSSSSIVSSQMGIQMVNDGRER